MKVELNKVIMDLQDVANLYYEQDKIHKEIIRDFEGAAPFEQKVAEAAEGYKAKLSAVLYRLTQSVDTLAGELEKASAFDPADQSIGSTASMLQNDGIDSVVIQKIAASHRTNQTALSLLCAAARPEYKGAFEVYMIDTDECIKKIRSCIESLRNSANYNSIPSYVSSIRIELTKLMEAEGVDVGMGGIIERMKYTNIAMLVGLDPEEF